MMDNDARVMVAEVIESSSYSFAPPTNALIGDGDTSHYCEFVPASIWHAKLREGVTLIPWGVVQYWKVKDARPGIDPVVFFTCTLKNYKDNSNCSAVWSEYGEGISRKTGDSIRAHANGCCHRLDLFQWEEEDEMVWEPLPANSSKGKGDVITFVNCSFTAGPQFRHFFEEGVWKECIVSFGVPSLTPTEFVFHALAIARQTRLYLANLAKEMTLLCLSIDDSATRNESMGFLTVSGIHPQKGFMVLPLGVLPNLPPARTTATEKEYRDAILQHLDQFGIKLLTGSSDKKGGVHQDEATVVSSVSNLVLVLQNDAGREMGCLAHGIQNIETALSQLPLAKELYDLSAQLANLVRERARERPEYREQYKTLFNSRVLNGPWLARTSLISWALENEQSLRAQDASHVPNELRSKLVDGLPQTRELHALTTALQSTTHDLLQPLPCDTLIAVMHLIYILCKVKQVPVTTETGMAAQSMLLQHLITRFFAEDLLVHGESKSGLHSANLFRNTLILFSLALSPLHDFARFDMSNLLPRGKCEELEMRVLCATFTSCSGPMITAQQRR